MTLSELKDSILQHFGEGTLHFEEEHGELTIETRVELLKVLLAELKDPAGHGFDAFIDMTGVDYLIPEKRTKVLYWLRNPKTLERVRVIVYVGRDGSLPSITDLWEGADWYERELYDLFGISFTDHPDLKRILMPDDWTGHPLRRDYALTEEPVEFKHGVKPKIPSKVIGHG